MIILAVIGKIKVTIGLAEPDINLTHLCGKFIGTYCALQAF